MTMMKSWSLRVDFKRSPPYVDGRIQVPPKLVMKYPANLYVIWVLPLFLYLSFALDIFAADPLPSGFRQAELIFVAEVKDSTLGAAVGLSQPPRYSVEVSFVNEELIRGSEVPKGVLTQIVYAENPPLPRVSSKQIVAATQSPNGWIIEALLEATDDNLARAKRFASIPHGWTFEADEVISPWASLDDYQWPKDAQVKGEVFCTKTGRPALFAAKNLVLEVEQVVPKNANKFQNPFGDGKFQVSLSNRGTADVEVPALLTDNGQILWEASMVAIQAGEAYPLGRTAPSAEVKSVTLKGGETLTGYIDVLPLEGVQWPRGGSRVSFNFCLGELSASHFFYYFSGLHDKMREAIRAN